MEYTRNARLTARNGDALVFQGIRIEGDLRGAMFEAVVEQRFRNPSEKNIEVVYDFPLPWNAVLLGVDVVLGGKRLTGAVVEKRQAEARYEDAIADGDAAIMLEKRPDGSYGANLGNLAARETCVVTLRYAQRLQFEQGGLRLIVPSVIAPRYGNPADGGLMPHQVPEHDIQVEYPLQLTIRLHGKLARARVASPSHAIGIESGGDVVTVTLARAAALDRDFVLTLDKLAHDSLVLVAPDAVEPEKFAVLASFRPRLFESPGVEGCAAPPVTVKILVDCSGSMAGDSIEAARKALHEIVEQLKNGDRFSLSRFGDRVEHRSRGLWKATIPTKAAAHNWTNRLDGDMGGTEMEQALVSTFALNKSNAVCDVLLITDGEIFGVEQTLQTARESGHRVFAVGIGASPAEGLLRRIAETTGGACDFVAPGEDARKAIVNMFARLRSPRVSDLQLEWPQGAEIEWTSSMPAALFDGDTFSVYALARKLPQGEIRLKGRSRDDVGIVVARAEIAPADETAANLSRLAAAARCAGAEPAEAARLAVAYQLVTDNTNFLLVHERAPGEKAEDMPELQKVVQMMPAGWGGMGSIIRYERDCDYAPAVYVSTVCEPVHACYAPAVFRRASPARSRLQGIGSGSGFDIPAFLRRQIGESELFKAPKVEKGHFIDNEYYSGLTPLGMAARLAKYPDTEWHEIEKAGLGLPVFSWLIHSVSARSGVSQVGALTKAFLFLMALPVIFKGLKKGKQPLRIDRDKILAEIQKAFAAGRLTADEAAALDIIMEDLADMTAENWPDAVFEMAA